MAAAVEALIKTPTSSALVDWLVVGGGRQSMTRRCFPDFFHTVKAPTSTCTELAERCSQLGDGLLLSVDGLAVGRGY